MVETKLVEVRDIGTFIPALVIRMTAENESQGYLMGRAGFLKPPLQFQPSVILMKLSDQEATADSYAWKSGARTMPVAHEWLLDHFDDIEDGSVVDVEFILGETNEPKKSERGGLF
jgi:hypothetical protein